MVVIFPIDGPFVRVVRGAAAVERRLEMECHRNIEVIWLLRSPKHDFKTIADFRRDYRAGFRSLFREFVLTRCKNPRGRRLDDYLRRLDEGDVEEGGTGGGARARRHR